MRRVVVVALTLMLAARLVAAQDQSNSTHASDSDTVKDRNLPIDPDKLADAVRESYYHPDNLSVLECNVSFDWSGVLRALHIDDLEPEQGKVIDGLKVRTRAVRNAAPETTLTWSGGNPPDKDRIETGIRQTISSFYQIYWQMMASPSLPLNASFAKVEPLDDGTVKAHVTQSVGSVEFTIDKDRVPIHYAIEFPAMNAMIDAHYTPSPKPVTGDLRRLTELDVSQQKDATTRKYEAILDYQPVGEFFVPQHVTFNVVGEFSVGMDFSGCSATKGAPAADTELPHIRVH
jgi:hypothetical protein